MIVLFLVLALATNAYGYGRIVGGEYTNIEKYNYQVSLEFQGIHICGGALLRQDVVVTAAHCVHDDKNLKESFQVRAGSTIVEIGGETLRAKEIYEDERYNPSTLDYDVAVIILNGKFILSEKIGTIELVQRGLGISVGTQSVVSGWGGTKAGEWISARLRAVRLPNIDWIECSDAYSSRSLTRRMSCWGSIKGGSSACKTDSGGPLVISSEEGTSKLAGIVSWRIRCDGEEHPGVYTDVSNADINDFITKYLLDK